MLLIILIFVLTVLFFAYIILSTKKEVDHWKNRGVKYVQPLPFVGNMLPTITQSKSMTEVVKSFYDDFPKERYVGMFQFATPVLVIRDPELIKSITIKNFEHFVDHSVLFSTETDPLWAKNIFSSQGERWRDLRQVLTPIFTSSKMKAMFVLMNECAKQMVDHFKNEKKGLIEVELKDVCSRVSNDVIANIAFGISCDSFKNPKNEFFLTGKDLVDFDGLKRFKFLLFGSYPRLAKWFKVRMIPTGIAKFFESVIDETIGLREKNKTSRPDLIHLLMLSRQEKLKYEDYLNLSKSGFPAFKQSNQGPIFLSNEDITAQAVVFFFGGYDTVSSLMAFVGYELAINPQIQAKLRQEVASTHNECNGDITYEDVCKMKYLDMVISESLRRWPQAPWIDRKCTKAFVINPEREGEQPLKINVGDICLVPIIGLHMDPHYFPKPHIFDPERFNEEKGQNIKAATYLPFGIGPRNCIGSRFALLETKILLYRLLVEFEIVPTDKTDIPVKLKKSTVMMMPENDFHIALRHAPLV